MLPKLHRGSFMEFSSITMAGHQEEVEEELEEEIERTQGRRKHSRTSIDDHGRDLSHK